MCFLGGGGGRFGRSPSSFKGLSAPLKADLVRSVSQSLLLKVLRHSFLLKTNRKEKKQAILLLQFLSNSLVT